MGLWRYHRTQSTCQAIGETLRVPTRNRRGREAVEPATLGNRQTARRIRLGSALAGPIVVNRLTIPVVLAHVRLSLATLGLDRYAWLARQAQDKPRLR
jgi:hypothetical protein